MLDRLTVKTPCDASWDAMVGDDRVVHCCRCNRNVYDLDAMHPDEAEAFLEEHLAKTGSLPCSRLYRRRDGRVMTSRCPKAVDRAHRARVATSFGAVATMALALLYVNRPVLGPDDTLVVDRRVEAPAHDVGPAFAQLGEVTLADEDDADETANAAWLPLWPPPTFAPVSVTLRGEKAPLLWSVARR